MPVCERVGARIFYEDRGDGPPVLLVHGGLHEPMSASRFWTEAGITDALVAAGHRVIVPHRRWSPGATEAAVVPHTWMLEGEDLAAVLRHAHPGPAVVLAGSNGCSAALRLAVDAGGLVAGLVLAWPVGPRDRRLEAAFERSAAFVAAEGVAAYLDELRGGVPGWASKRPGLAFGVALTTDRTAEEPRLRCSVPVAPLRSSAGRRQVCSAERRCVGSTTRSCAGFEAPRTSRSSRPRATARSTLERSPRASPSWSARRPSAQGSPSRRRRSSRRCWSASTPKCASCSPASAGRRSLPGSAAHQRRR